jgi:hypothetical protein
VAVAVVAQVMELLTAVVAVVAAEFVMLWEFL